MTSSLAIRHVAFEDLGTLAPVLDQSGIAPRYLDGWSPDLAHVDPVAPDLVVVLGGPIGVYEVAAYPWLAHEIGMSTRQVQRLFEAERTTFAREVRDRRLNLAASNLRRRRPVGKARISEIAYNSGFRDLSNFNRGFKSRFGMTPREYLETMG